MKVLYLFFGIRSNLKRIHFDFIETFMNLPEVDVKVYGPNEQILNGDLISPIGFDIKLQLNDIIKELDIDILLLPELGLCKKYFSTCGINDVKSIPKVIFESDFYAIIDVDWYKRMGINLMLMLHPYEPNVLPIESVWLPPSVSGEQFLVEGVNNDRINRMVFVGGGRYSTNKYYKVRQDAIRILENNDLIDWYGEVGYEEYPKILKVYKSALSCSFPPLNFPPIKTFEIMASGTILLTTSFKYKNALFGDEKCFFTYNKDCSDIINIAKYIQNNTEEARQVAEVALQKVKDNHLFEHRVKELFLILTSLLNHNNIPKRWGI